MADINEALKKLVLVLNKYSIQGVDSTKDVSNKDGMISERINSSHELKTFYSELRPDNIKIETGYSPLKIYSPNDINAAQSGYQNLPADYIVFIDDFGGGKPIIAATVDSGTPVYANYDVGKPFKIANDFTSFLLCLAETIDVVYGSYDVFDIADDDDVLKSEFSQELKDRVESIIGEENFASWFDYLYG